MLLKKPWWHYGWSSFFTFESYRAKKCKAAGTHYPVIIDMGRRKMCFICGAW